MDQIYDMSRTFGRAFKGTIAGRTGIRSPYLGTPDLTYQFDNRDAVDLLAAAWSRELSRNDKTPRKGVFLYGPTGSGKTTLMREFFWRIGVPLLQVTWSPRMEASDLVSTKTVIGGDVLSADQVLLIAARQGFPCVINELDLADPAELASINEPIEKGEFTMPDGEVVVAKRGFFVCATANSNGGDDEQNLPYVGVRTQNAAAMRRFFHAKVEYPTDKDELTFLVNAVKKLGIGVPDSVVQSVASVVGATRRAYVGTLDNKRLSAAMSRTEALDMLMLLSSMSDRSGRSPAERSFDWVYANRMQGPDRVTAHEILQSCWSAPTQPVTP